MVSEKNFPQTCTPGRATFQFQLHYRKEGMGLNRNYRCNTVQAILMVYWDLDGTSTFQILQEKRQKEFLCMTIAGIFSFFQVQKIWLKSALITAESFSNPAQKEHLPK